MPRPEHSKPIRLATVAFQAALSSKTDTAARYVKRISDECGGEGIYVALLAWIDTYTDHATDGRESRARSRMAYIDESTGALDREDSDRLPPEIRWAGQLVAARASLNEPRFQELITEMPSDGVEVGVYVMAVLTTIARTVNGLPRGFSRMGGS